MKKHLSIGLSAFALAALLSGCAGGATTTTPTSAAPATSAPAESSTSAPAGSAPASTSAAVLSVGQSTAGQIVVAGQGLSVYYFTKNTKDSGNSACTGACLTSWPPVTSTTATPTVNGVTGKVGTIPSANGKMQVTINGMPIYYYSKDQAAGDITGQGVGGVWYLVAPSGEMITAPSSY